MIFNIRKAKEKDIGRILELLRYIANLHHNAFPDVFKDGFTKYSEDQLKGLLGKKDVAILVAVDRSDRVVGHAIAFIVQEEETNAKYYTKYIYLDDLCVDKDYSGNGIGSSLIREIKKYGKENNCSRIELHAWDFDGSATDFYKKIGFKTKYQTMGIDI